MGGQGEGGEEEARGENGAWQKEKTHENCDAALSFLPRLRLISSHRVSLRCRWTRFGMKTSADANPLIPDDSSSP